MNSFKKIGLCLGSFLIVFMLAFSAQAQSPTDELHHVIDDILTVLKDPAYKDEATRPPLREKIENAIGTMFDFTAFSMRTLGANWKKFSPAEQKEFTQAFSKLFLNTYLDQIDGYNGEQIEYNGQRLAKNNTVAEVQTVVTMANGNAVSVAYRMMLKNNKWSVYDILVESVGLNSNYRSQFKDFLAKNKPADLIATINKKNANN